MRQTTIIELIEEAKEIFLIIKHHKNISRPKVKSIFEHLRSSLEYVAHDINSVLIKPRPDKDRFYFPYGWDMESLKNSTNKNLPSLQIERQDIFNEIVKLHNFELRGEWLKNLCDMTNHTKHKDAIDIRSDSEIVSSLTVSANGLNLIHSSGGSSNISFTNCTLNGRKIDDFTINKGEVKILKKGDVPINFKITKNRTIIVGNKEIDLIPFLDSSIKDIEKFIESTYGIL